MKDGVLKVMRGLAAAVVAVAAAIGIYAPNFGNHPDVAYPAHVAQPGSYVALGDSYSAGEGLAPYLPGTGDPPGSRCHRSILGYGPVLGVATTGTPGSFRACSGAVIDNVLGHEQHPGIGVQVPTTDPSTTLVTFTIGGNDALFSTIVTFCTLHLHCLDNPAWHQHHPEPTLQAFAAAQIPEIGDHLLPMLYQGLRQRFTNPNLRVIVLGYPQLFTPGSAFATTRSCQSVYGLFSAAERTGLRKLEDDLNGLIARDAVAAGFEYVQLSDAFVGHETCGPKGPWLNFLHGGLRELDSFAHVGGVDPGDFHPTASGQAMMARLVSCYLTHHPSDPYTGPPPSTAKTVADAVGSVAVGRAGDAVYACAADHPADPTGP